MPLPSAVGGVYPFMVTVTSCLVVAFGIPPPSLVSLPFCVIVRAKHFGVVVSNLPTLLMLVGSVHGRSVVRVRST